MEKKHLIQSIENIHKVSLNVNSQPKITTIFVQSFKSKNFQTNEDFYEVKQLYTDFKIINIKYFKKTELTNRTKNQQN